MKRRVCATHGTARAVRCGVGRVRACLLNQDGACRAQFLSPDAAKDLVDKENALLLDVREDYEFAEVCISTSVNRDLLEQKERPIRHYSSTGTTINLHSSRPEQKQGVSQWEEGTDLATGGRSRDE